MTKHTAEKLLKWRAIVQEYKSSELTPKEFCKLRGINYSTFKGWHRELRAEAEPGLLLKEDGLNIEAFREVRAIFDQSNYIVTLRNGRRLQISESFIETRLRKLIEILESC